MAAISSISSVLTSPSNVILNHTTKPFSTLFSKPNFQPGFFLRFNSVSYPTSIELKRLHAVAEETSVSAAESSSEVARRLYVGNIPRNLTNDELKKIVEEHGAVEKAEVMYDKWSKRSRRFAFVTMKTTEDANVAVEKLNGTEVGGREIKVNVTEKPLTSADASLLQAEETPFTDSPHKVYVGNIAKTVTTEKLLSFFSGTGKVLSAKVSRVPGTSKSSGYGFVTFSSEEGVEAAISSLNDQVLDGQKIRVNKA